MNLYTDVLIIPSPNYFRVAGICLEAGEFLAGIKRMPYSCRVIFPKEQPDDGITFMLDVVDIYRGNIMRKFSYLCLIDGVKPEEFIEFMEEYTEIDLEEI